jgi:hypothetical protein
LERAELTGRLTAAVRYRVRVRANSILAKMQVKKSHDELIKQLGPAYQLITDAGFVIVPKKWRDDLITLGRVWQIGQ